MPSKGLPATPAADALLKVLSSGIELNSIEKTYDMLKLMGLVLGHAALLEIATSPTAESAARVSAARALVNVKDDPESLAERLHSSPFRDLSIEQLKGIVRQIEAGERDITSLVKELAHAPSDQ